MYRAGGAICATLVLTLSACQTTPPQNQALDSVDVESAQSHPRKMAPAATPQIPQAPNRQNSAPATNANNPAATPAIQQSAFVPKRLMKTGELQHPALSEVSGIAAAINTPNTLWAINDSGNAATLYALSHTGEALGSFAIDARNRDWEDLASATINGTAYLLIGDIGDNLRIKHTNAIHVIAEPALNAPATGKLQTVHTLRFQYPDRAHNAEAMAYADGHVYVLTKESLLNGKRQPSLVFKMPLDLNSADTVVVAQHVGALAIPRGSIESSLIASLSGVDVSQPTAFDIDPQNRNAYVLTYRSIYHYQREPEQDWAQALAQTRVRIHAHSLSQAEALAVSGEGVVWFTSEKRPAPLWALPVPDY